MPITSLKTLFRSLLVLVVPTLLALAFVDLQLRMPISPHGIVSFEFCGWVGSCEATLAAWGEQGRQWAMLSLGLDYLFMLEYAGLVCLGLLMAEQRLVQSAAPGPARVARVFASIALLAGGFDAAENLCLIGVVHSGQGAALAHWAALFASIKFVLIAAALIALAAVWWRIKKSK